MTCSSTFLEYPSTVLAETSPTYIFITMHLHWLFLLCIAANQTNRCTSSRDNDFPGHETGGWWSKSTVCCPVSGHLKQKRFPAPFLVFGKQSISKNIPGTWFRSLSVEPGFWIPILSRIPDSLSCIPDSKARDSGLHKQNFPGFHRQKSPGLRNPYLALHGGTGE